MAVGVWVGEKAGLEDRVGRSFNTWDHVGGREGGLLDFGEVVFRVLVESEAAEAAEGNFGLRPDLGEVEDVPAELLGLLGAQDLDVAGPRRVLAAGDGTEKVLGVPVRVFSG